VAGRRNFDVLVAGGGTAGCVVAARLSQEPGRSVCLVEAGPDYGPFAAGRWPADILDARQLAFSHSWETDREDRSQLRARILGGCSAHNACVLLAGAPADYDEWGHGWTYDTLGPYLDRAREQLRARRLRAEELSPWHAAWAEAAPGDGILHPVNIVDGIRWNTAFAYIDEARGRPNLTILDRTLVQRVESERRRLVTDRGDLEAGKIVLAAGAYGSPGILLRSGIGPGLEHDLPVGEGLSDHVGTGMGWEPTGRLQEEAARFEAEHPLAMAQLTIEARSSRCEDGVCDLFLFPAIDPGYEISAAVFAMKPLSRGRVALNSDDPRAPLAIEHGFLSDERDADVLAEGFEKLRSLGLSEQVGRYAGPEIRPGIAVDAADHVRTTARGFFHPVGTCALGSVVDDDCRVLGFESLYVCDASVVPSIPRANTNLTVAALAERFSATF
jgi:choline dehydrogenase-like flavoprotein